MSDELIQALAENGGVIGINFGSAFLTEEANQWSQARSEARTREQMVNGHNAVKMAEWNAQYLVDHPYPFADLNDVLDHIDHVVELVGVEHVGIGSDYDGVGNSLPVGLKTVADYPNLVDGLLERGYNEDQIKLVLGENFMRVWQQVEDVASD